MTPFDRRSGRAEQLAGRLWRFSELPNSLLSQMARQKWPNWRRSPLAALAAWGPPTGSYVEPQWAGAKLQHDALYLCPMISDAYHSVRAHSNRPKGPL